MKVTAAQTTICRQLVVKTKLNHLTGEIQGKQTILEVLSVKKVFKV